MGIGEFHCVFIRVTLSVRLMRFTMIYLAHRCVRICSGVTFAYFIIAFLRERMYWLSTTLFIWCLRVIKVEHHVVYVCLFFKCSGRFLGLE